MIRNLRTDYVSPQFHVVYDEKFETVPSLTVVDQVENWTDLFVTARDNYLEGHDPDTDGPIPALAPEWTIDDENVQAAPLPPAVEELEIDDDDRSDRSPEPELGSKPTDPPETENAPLSQTRRSNRLRNLQVNATLVTLARASSSLEAIIKPTHVDTVVFQAIDWSAPSLDWSKPLDELQRRQFEAFFDQGSDPSRSDLVDWHPITFQAKVYDADNPSLRDVLLLPEPEKSQWLEAMNAELTQLMEKNCFEVFDRSDIMQKGFEIVKSTWVLRRKRFPDGQLNKLKARFCVRGDMQVTNISASTTYAPVVDWSIVRTLFTASVALNLTTASIDFRNAFVQSSLPEPIYIELPPGGIAKNPDFKGKILKVNKSLYGDRRAPQLWYNHLRTGFEALGFKVSRFDPCLFLRPGCIIIIYVDDAIIVANNRADIDKLFTQLRGDDLPPDERVNLEDSQLVCLTPTPATCPIPTSDEDETVEPEITPLTSTRRIFDFDEDVNLSSYLGIQIDKEGTDGTLKLSQPHLTSRFIELLGLSDARAVHTPVTETLGRCKDAHPFSHDFNYRSAIGVAMYLTNNTRMDCSMAIHQCARFSTDPRQPHEQALKRVGRYLKGTKSRGLLIKPGGKVKIDCYVDADFAGLHGSEDPQDPSSARSRTGYVLLLCGIPVVWASKMQTLVALSTMEAEYIALSTAMRALLPMRNILFQCLRFLGHPIDASSRISTVFEDNQATKILATTNPPQLTPRSKHIAIRYHWFREHLSPDTVVVDSIDTKEQLADIVTKPLATTKFQQARQKTMGW
jgi:hypothetical protein